MASKLFKKNIGRSQNRIIKTLLASSKKSSKYPEASWVFGVVLPHPSFQRYDIKTKVHGIHQFFQGNPACGSVIQNKQLKPQSESFF